MPRRKPRRQPLKQEQHVGETLIAGQAGRGLIAGAAGAAIEVITELPRNTEVKGLAVIAHPHPLYGGTLDNKVVYMLARGALDAGAATLRFNFRGVGSSEGVHDEGEGEGDDLLKVVAHARAGWPDLPLAVAGFSFGAFVALSKAREAGARGVLTVAPPLMYVGTGQAPVPGVPWWMIHGDADEVVDYADTLRRAQAAPQPPERIQTAEGVGHFFHGELPQVRKFASEFFEQAFATVS